MRKTLKEINMPIMQKIIDGICMNHTGKMEGMWSYSTSCLVNPRCVARMKNGELICASCFAANQQSFQCTLREKLIRNFHFITETEVEVEDFPMIPLEQFRLQSFGEVFNLTELSNYFNFATRNPKCIFALWMKDVFIVTMARKLGWEKPENIILIKSSPRLNQIEETDEPWIDKIFTVFEKEFLKNHEVNINCGSNLCLGCLRCYRHNGIRYINEIKKGGEVNLTKIEDLNIEVAKIN